MKLDPARTGHVAGLVTGVRYVPVGRGGAYLPAGRPSEVAVIADPTADPVLVAADLLAQTEHGPESPAALVTTSEALVQRVLEEVSRRVDELKTQEILRVSWADHGSVIVAEDREVAAELMDDLAPEHLEIITADGDWYHERLSNRGSTFLGTWSTVAHSDKGMAGTNHTLPTAGGARHSAGPSVARFLNALTYQRVTREATPPLANAVDVISEDEGMAAPPRHRDAAHRSAHRGGGVNAPSAGDRPTRSFS